MAVDFIQYAIGAAIHRASPLFLAYNSQKVNFMTVNVLPMSDLLRVDSNDI
jgi:hypothetical protein